MAGGGVGTEAIGHVRRRQRGELAERGDPQPLQGDGQVGPRQRGDRPRGEEVRRPSGRDDQFGGGGQDCGEEPVGHTDADVLVRLFGQEVDDRLLAAEETGGPARRQRADPEPDGMHPGADFARARHDAGKAPRLLSPRPFLEELGTPDDDQPFHAFFSTTPLRPPPARRRPTPANGRLPLLRLPVLLLLLPVLLLLLPVLLLPVLLLPPRPSRRGATARIR